ncbi:putative ribonuclease H-like domain-containing protein [Tanacetum coccineum]
MVPRTVLLKSGLVSLNTARQVNTAHPKITMNSARPMTNLSKLAHSTVKPKAVVNAARPKAVVNAVKRDNVNVVKASACWVWKPKTKVLDHGNPQMDLQDKGVIDSGCSRHMTGNMSYLTDYEEIDGGYVAFGGNPKGGKITRKGTIKTGNLDFENVYFVRELKFNLFSVSQMCDKKNSVLFNDTECIVLSPNFKLTDESHVLLKVPRKNNMYSVDLKNIVPKGGTKACDDACKASMETVPGKDYILLPLWTADPPFSQSSKSSPNDGSKPSSDDGKKVDENPRKENDPNIPALEDIVYSDDDEDVGVEADMNNLDAFMPVSPIPTTRIHKDHPVEQIIGDLNSAPQTRRMTKNLEEHGLFSSVQQRTNHKDFQNCLFACFLSQEEPKKVIHALKDPSWIEAMQEELLQFKGTCSLDLVDLPKNKGALALIEEGIDYDEVFAPVARIKAIRLFLAYASFKDFVLYMMDVKSAFLYGKIEEEVYVCQPPGFEDLNFPNRVYKVEKALYGLYQAPRAWYETLSTYLLENRFQRGKTNKTLFIRRDKGDILLVQVYVDDIIFSSTKKSLCTEFEKMMHTKFQMSSIGELTFFLGLQVKQKEDGIFISQDKYVTEILKKFSFTDVKTASTPMETQKLLLKDEDGKEVDVHLYRSMIGSLMYLTSSRPDIMFAVCACARYQVNPKVSHLHAVKRIFRYLKGQPKLGLWYPKDSPFDLVAYTDSDYAGASLDKKSTIGGCQFLGSRLISWQCKKQTVVANSITEAEYVAASSCCGQVLWIQNQLLDYGSFIEQFWATVKAKPINGEVQLQALLDGKKVIITESTLRRDLHLEDAEGVDSTNQKFKFSKYIFESMVKNLENVSGKFLMYPRRSKRKDTEVPRPSGPTTNVADEVVNREMDDSLEKAATTATNLDAEIESSKDKGLGEEDASKQGRIDDIDANEDIYLVNVHRDEDMFRVNDLEGDEVVVETEVDHEVVVETEVASKDVNLSADEVTLAQALVALKSAKPKANKAKGLVIHEEEQATTPTVSSQQLSQVKVQDKGKEIMVEEPLKMKKKDQVSFDKQEAKRLQAKFDEDERLAREKDEANVALTEEWNDIQAKINGNYQLAQRLQAQEKEELTDAEKARLFVQLLEQRRKHFAAKRAEEKRNRPPTRAQQRSIMCTYLKNMEGWKPKSLKSKSFANIQELFDKAFKRVNTFVDYRTELVEESSKKADAEVAQESSSKRAGEALEQESSKKQKVEEDKESEELKQCLEIIPDDGDDVTIDATPLSTKSPTIVDYKIYKEGKKSYFQIIRADGNSQMYLTFGKMLKNFNREDLEVLWSIVKARFKKTEPVNYMDNFLLLNLKTMFEHHVEDSVWKNQQGLVKVLNWKLYDSCGVHCVTMQSILYYLLVEKMYPLTNHTLHQMFNDVKLQVDYECEMAFELLRLVKKQLKEGYGRIVGIKSLLEVTAAKVCVTAAKTKMPMAVPISMMKFGNDQIALILGYGDLAQGNIIIKWVYYVEGLNHNLFSIGQFCDADLEVTFQKSTCYIRDLKGNDIITGSRGTDHYSITL